MILQEEPQGLYKRNRYQPEPFRLILFPYRHQTATFSHSTSSLHTTHDQFISPHLSRLPSFFGPFRV